MTLTQSIKNGALIALLAAAGCSDASSDELEDTGLGVNCAPAEPGKKRSCRVTHSRRNASAIVPGEITPDVVGVPIPGPCGQLMPGPIQGGESLPFEGSSFATARATRDEFINMLQFLQPQEQGCDKQVQAQVRNQVANHCLGEMAPELTISGNGFGFLTVTDIGTTTQICFGNAKELFAAPIRLSQRSGASSSNEAETVRLTDLFMTSISNNRAMTMAMAAALSRVADSRFSFLERLIYFSTIKYVVEQSGGWSTYTGSIGLQLLAKLRDGWANVAFYGNVHVLNFILKALGTYPPFE